MPRIRALPKSRCHANGTAREEDPARFARCCVQCVNPAISGRAEEESITADRNAIRSVEHALRFVPLSCWPCGLWGVQWTVDSAFRQRQGELLGRNAAASHVMPIGGPVCGRGRCSERHADKAHKEARPKVCLVANGDRLARIVLRDEASPLRSLLARLRRRGNRNDTRNHT